MSDYDSKLMCFESKVSFDDGFRIQQHNEVWMFDGTDVRFYWRRFTERGSCSITEMFNHLLGKETNPAKLPTETNLALHEVQHCWWPDDKNETLHDFTVSFTCRKTGIDGRITSGRAYAEIAWAKSLTESMWGRDIDDPNNKFTSLGGEGFTKLMSPMWSKEDFRDEGWRLSNSKERK